MTFECVAKTVRFLTLLVLLLPYAAHAAADSERRIALVIGIGAYQNAPHLANPVNDARAIGEIAAPPEVRRDRAV